LSQDFGDFIFNLVGDLGGSKLSEDDFDGFLPLVVD
jgi:hypothetical protein